VGRLLHGALGRLEPGLEPLSGPLGVALFAGAASSIAAMGAFGWTAEATEEARVADFRRTKGAF
jgi:hypothetical protein